MYLVPHLAPLQLLLRWEERDLKDENTERISRGETGDSETDTVREEDRKSQTAIKRGGYERGR